MKMYPWKRMIALTILTAFSAATLSACNTTEGAGKDIKSAGSSIEQKAKEEKAEHRQEERNEQH